MFDRMCMNGYDGGVYQYVVVGFCTEVCYAIQEDEDEQRDLMCPGCNSILPFLPQR